MFHSQWNDKSTIEKVLHSGYFGSNNVQLYKEVKEQLDQLGKKYYTKTAIKGFPRFQVILVK